MEYSRETRQNLQVTKFDTTREGGIIIAIEGLIT
jgi:hypothetical protein